MLSGRLQNRRRTGHSVNHDITALFDSEFCHGVARDLLAPSLDGSSSSRRRRGGREFLLDLRDHSARFAPL